MTVNIPESEKQKIEDTMRGIAEDLEKEIKQRTPLKY